MKAFHKKMTRLYHSGIHAVNLTRREARSQSVDKKLTNREVRRSMKRDTRGEYQQELENERLEIEAFNEEMSWYDDRPMRAVHVTEQGVFCFDDRLA